MSCSGGMLGTMATSLGRADSAMTLTNVVGVQPYGRKVTLLASGGLRDLAYNRLIGKAASLADRAKLAPL